MSDGEGDREDVAALLRRHAEQMVGSPDVLKRNALLAGAVEIERLRARAAELEMQVKMLRVLGQEQNEDAPCSGATNGDMAEAFPVWVRVPCQATRYLLRRAEAVRLLGALSAAVEETSK